jgi:DNA-binding CsgD family transcriptional regulator
MSHFAFLFYILCLVGGFFSIGILIFIYLQKRIKLILDYALLMLSFSALLLSHTLGTYGLINLSVPAPTYILIKKIIAIVSGASVFYCMPYFFFRLFGIPFTKKINWFFILLNAVNIACFFYIVTISNMILFSVVLYCIILSIVKVREMTNFEMKSILKKYLIISAAFVPLIVFDAFLHVFPALERSLPFGIMAFPAYYLTIGAINMLFSLKYYHRLQPPGPTKLNFGKWGITRREEEVIRLLIEGKSYEDIASALTISLSTVKTHTNNIYRKLNIKNKIELVNMVGSLQQARC